MQALFLSTIFTILTHKCFVDSATTARSSTTTNLGVLIAVPIVGTFVLVFVIIGLVCLCQKCCPRTGRVGMNPLAAQMALSQDYNPYAPPGFNQAPPYGQPPYGQAPPSYPQTTSTSTSNVSKAPTNMAAVA